MIDIHENYVFDTNNLPFVPKKLLVLKEEGILSVVKESRFLSIGIDSCSDVNSETRLGSIHQFQDFP